jgi:hypothetical protein
MVPVAGCLFGCLRTVWWTSGVAAVGGPPSGGATTGLAACWWWYSHYGSASGPSALGGLLDLSKRVNGSGCLDLSGLVFTVQGMVVWSPGLQLWGMLVLHSSLADLAAPVLQPWLRSGWLAALSWATCTGLATCVVFFHTNPRAAADHVGFSDGFLEELPGGWWPGQWPVQAAVGDEIKKR